MAVASPQPKSALNWRTLVLALILIPINVFWITIVEVRWYSLDGTSLPLFITPVFMLFMLVLANLAARKTGRGLSQAELILVYVMLVTSSAFASHDLIQNMFGSIGHAYRFATPENDWAKLFFSHLPKFLLVTDKAELSDFYGGASTPYRASVLLHWWVPLACWALLMLVLCGMMMCINLIIQKQWTQNEKLAFPIVQLPLAMTDPEAGRGFFRNSMMWTGFAIAFGIGLFNGMHFVSPGFPELYGIKLYEIGQYFPNRPWSAVAGTNISMYPFAIGLAYFIPLDLSFSCWFFFVARKLFQVLGAANGWDSVGNAFPFFPEQASGAWVTWGLIVLFSARKLFAAAWRKAFTAGDPENLTYRLCYSGLFIGIIFLSVWGYLIGISLWCGALFFLIFFVLALALTRVRAELGTPHEIYFCNPRTVIVTLFGTGAIGTANLTALSTMYWFNRGYRSHPMANQLEALKMGEVSCQRRSTIVAALAFSTIVAIAAAYWANLHVCYTAGAMAKCATGFKSWVGQESFATLATWLKTPQPFDSNRLSYMAGGALMVVFLRIMRGSFLSWPFHPAGYALAVSYAMDYFWFAYLVR